MKFFNIILIVILFSCIAYAQPELENSFNEGVNLLKKEKYKKAIQIFSDVLDKATVEKLKKFCYIYRGLSYNGLGDYESAIADFDQAMVIDPNDLASYVDRGKAKYKSKDLFGAKEDFEYVFSNTASDNSAELSIRYLASIMYKLQDFESSIGYYNRIITLSPDEAELYFNRGASKGMIMDIPGSIADYDQAISLDSNYTDAYANRGTQKINAIPAKDRIGIKDCIKEPCDDFLMAKKLGDSSVDDMIFLYCQKCK